MILIPLALTCIAGCVCGGQVLSSILGTNKTGR